MSNIKKNQISPIDKLKKVLDAESVRKQFENALQENAGAFVASIIDLYSSDTYLQQCDPSKVVMEALKAATLKLPINKQLGFAYIVPYRSRNEVVPQFQIGYRGYIQLAMRTGQYRHLNSGMVCEGVRVEHDLLTGKVKFSGETTSDKAIGYFAYMELLNGFTKTVYMTKDEVIEHAQKYSPSYNNKSSAWQTNFDAMAEKTVIRRLLSKYGIMSTEMVTALTADTDFNDEASLAEEVAQNANAEVIDIEVEEAEEDPEEAETTESGQMKLDPGF